MLRATRLTYLGASVALLLAAGLAQAVPANKCIVDGQVTYQQGPCPTGQTRRPPTVEELNAREKQRRADAAAAAPAATTAAPKSSPAAPSTTTSTPAPPAALTGFRCDGRQHCSQMKSCAEARFFLANCPGVKMDGDNDGIPCELEHCR